MVPLTLADVVVKQKRPRGYRFPSGARYVPSLPGAPCAPETPFWRKSQGGMKYVRRDRGNGGPAALAKALPWQGAS
jgi:hypothetical protein